jgi:predicted site-specific integrase-resolvase
MSAENYVSASKACKRLGISPSTLRDYANQNKIKTIKTEGGWRKYNLSEYLKKNKLSKRNKICYCRVSSSERKQDLENQINYLMEKYPDFSPITDIGSGINFKRKGLKLLIDMAIRGELDILVLTYKDRLCRIGYELLEYIFVTYSQTNIIIENNRNESINDEITNDLIEIITVYSAKIHGKRHYDNTSRIENSRKKLEEKKD